MINKCIEGRRLMTIDNLKVEKQETLNGETMWQVRNIDTDVVLFVCARMIEAMDYADGKVGYAK